jgi:hypothetical protein
MELVRVRTYRETSFPMRYGSAFERGNGEITKITTGMVSESNAKHEAQLLVADCKWDTFIPDRKDGFIEVGHGYMDGLPPG